MTPDGGLLVLGVLSFGAFGMILLTAVLEWIARALRGD